MTLKEEKAYWFKAWKESEVEASNLRQRVEGLESILIRIANTDPNRVDHRLLALEAVKGKS